MKKPTYLWINALLLAMLILTSSSFATKPSIDLTAAEILQISDDKVRGLNSQGEITMTIIRPDWTREMGMRSWSRGEDFSLILITSPVRDKGVTFLKRNKELWNWQPTIDRVIKLPPSMMMQSWMGSDFTNDDLVRESSMVHDYDHQLLGDTTIEDRECYKIEMIPHEDAAVVWGKILIWISKEEYLQLLVQFYDEDGYLVSTMIGSDIRELGGRLLPARLEMIPEDEPGNKTVIEYKWLDFDEQLDEDFFSIQNMKRIH